MDENTRQNLVITFNVSGRLKYLSHQETARMFERAFIRTGISLRFSEGFNPHPKMSLPLPRTVSVASFGDVVCAEIASDISEMEGLKSSLQKQLPDGCEVVNVKVVSGKVSYQPTQTEYVFDIGNVDTKIREQIEKFQQRCADEDEIVIERWSEKKKKYKTANVAEFLQSIDIEGDEVKVKVNITPKGTIRVNEILDLAGVTIDDIQGGVARRNTVFSE